MGSWRLQLRWVQARYRAYLHEINERYAEWEAIDEPEVRVSDPNGGYFSSWPKR